LLQWGGIALVIVFAAALAYSLDISLENIRHGLRTFDTTFFQAPGRLNLYDEHPFKVILDYGHNPAAVKVMCELVDRFDVDGKKIVVLSAPGDRRDQDIEEIGTISAGHFDHYILKTDDNARGRDRDEVPGILRKMLLESAVSKDNIEIIDDEKTSVEHALAMAQPGDLVFIFGDNIKRCWKQIIYFDSGGKTEQDEKPVQIKLSTTELGDFSLEDVEIIRDERGVRIAREPEEAD
ncbi:MAG: cyanophycin synthetase, partial [Proteobacteria bacterium]|nr:cyanophycin synthetase [Pseudomonadota bacterium]